MISKYSLLKHARIKRKPKYLFIGHFLDLGGAPLVLFDIIQEFIAKYSAENIELFAQAFSDEYQEIIDKQLGISSQLFKFYDSDDKIDYLLNINPDDFVFMNSSAVAWNMRDRLLYYLESGKLKKLHWYTHEGDPLQYLDNEHLTKRITKLCKAGKLIIYAPAKQTQENFEKQYRIKVDLAPYKFSLPEKYNIDHTEKDYDQINFVINGTAGDGRKGQYSIITAFYYFFVNYFKNNENKYRDFNLTFIGLGKEFVPTQIDFIGRQLLGKRFINKGQLPHEKALDEMTKAHANVTYSFLEALPLNILESMFMGQFLLRNSCSGVDEQLRHGKNGFLLPEKDIIGFAEIIERVLNKNKTTNRQLLEMGLLSKEMVREFADISYLQHFE